MPKSLVSQPVLTGNTSCFSESNIKLLKSIMSETTVETGTFLYWEGDEADKLYYIIQGRIKITKSSDEGRRFILYMFQDGDMFGQMDPYRNSIQSFNAEASETSLIGVIEKEDLIKQLRQNGELAVEFMNWMGLIHRTTQTKFRDLMMFGKLGALCSTLIRLANMYGKIRQDGILIQKKFTNTEIADMIGATRESVNRMLSDLKANNAIKYDNGLTVITNIGYLKNICHCENCSIEICRI